jgi:hypothetical protein
MLVADRCRYTERDTRELATLYSHHYVPRPSREIRQVNAIMPECPKLIANIPQPWGVVYDTSNAASHDARYYQEVVLWRIQDVAS